MLTPRVDAASFVWKRFGAGPGVGVLKATGGRAVVAVSLTPAAQALEVRFGGAGPPWWPPVVSREGGWGSRPHRACLYCACARVSRSCCAAFDATRGAVLMLQRATSSTKKRFFDGHPELHEGRHASLRFWLGAYLTSLSVALPLFVSAASSLANAFNIAVECAEDVFDSTTIKHKKDDDAFIPKDILPATPSPKGGARALGHAASVVSETSCGRGRVAAAAHPLGQAPRRFYPLRVWRPRAWPLRAFFEVGTSGETSTLTVHGTDAALQAATTKQPRAPRRRRH